MKRTTVDHIHKNWMKNPKYRREYEALEEEFSIAAALIEAGARAGLTSRLGDHATPEEQSAVRRVRKRTQT